MSVIEYDPDNWLLSATRSLGSYVTATLDDPDVTVEMSFPNTRDWTHEMPLEKALIHFETDSINDPPIGFGLVGEEVYDAENGIWHVAEAAQHYINFDVGVWVAAGNGGGTKRMELCQKLRNMFSTVSGKTNFNEASGGLWVVSFDGGRNELDRINDLPVWRTMDMMLILHVFSRHIPPTYETVPLDFDQDPDLSIVSADGSVVPIDPD